MLLALVDADYKFIAIQVGDFGRTSDDGIYAASSLGRGMAANTLNVPKSEPLPAAEQLGEVPYVMVGDAAFPLKTFLMRPCPNMNMTREKSIYNYRLSRARMVVECAFGILAARWRVLYSRMTTSPSHIDAVVMAACILHNFLSNVRDNHTLSAELEERGIQLQPVRNMGGNRGAREAFDVHELFKAYFNSAEGSVSPGRDCLI